MSIFLYVLIGWTLTLMGTVAVGLGWLGLSAARNRDWPMVAFSGMAAVTILLLGAGVIVAMSA